MSSEGKKKRGISGMANAASKPYRLVGGNHDKPIITHPECHAAFKARGSDFRTTAAYATGLQGGLLAEAMGYPSHEVSLDKVREEIANNG